MTKSSVNFKALKSALHAVSHATRTVEPSYLLAKDKSLGTIVLLDDKGSVASTLEAKLALASRQALREKNYSPVWEGILNLPRPEVGFDADEYKKTCSNIVSSWCERYEASTGHKVLRADIHLDEGHMVDGESLLNAHAHIISDRTNDKGRVMQLSPKMLRELQTLTAEVTGLERGKSSLETGRKHISHQAYKYLAELGRLETQQQVEGLKAIHVKELDTQKNVTARIRGLFQADTPIINNLKEELAQLKEQYRLDRETMKASGEAKQTDYQALKAAYEAALAELKTTKENLQKMDDYSKNLKADLVESNRKIAAALEAKAQVIEELVRAGEKSQKLLETANGYREDAAKIQKIAANFKMLEAEIVELKAKSEALAKTHQEEAAEAKEQASELRQLKAEYGGYKEAVAARAAAEVAAAVAKPVPTIQHPREAVSPLGPNARAKLRAEQMVLEADKRAQELPKQFEVETPSPKPGKSLTERLSESMKAMLDWIRSIGAGQEPVTANSRHEGPVKHIDHLHCIQKTGRNSYAIHQLSHLDNIPALDDPKMQIKYLNGVGQVVGKLGQTPER